MTEFLVDMFAPAIVWALVFGAVGWFAASRYRVAVHVESYNEDGDPEDIDFRVVKR